jgi:ClpP class serine protease
MATISHLRHFVLAVGFLLLAAPGASALQYKRLPLDAPLLGIAVTGPIVSGDLDRLGAFLKTLPKQDEELHPGFFVDSPGGDIFEAEKIATLINKFAASVVIPSGSQGQ